MQQLRRAQEFEYRNVAGQDALARFDVWVNPAGDEVVLVIRDLEAPLWSRQDDLRRNAQLALSTLNATLLPYLLPDSARLRVLVLVPRPTGEPGKPRAWVLAA